MSAREVATVDFAVAGTYSIGPRFSTWEDAAAVAREQITTTRYRGQRVRVEAAGYHAKRYRQDGDDLLLDTRAFVEMRETGPWGDAPERTWEVFADGTAEVLP